MAKGRKRIDRDPAQLSLFEAVIEAIERDQVAPLTGAFNIDHQFRSAISEALKKSPKSRYHVAAEMSELVGVDITKTMLDSWTAERKEGHRFPAIFLPAFCKAAGSTEPLKLLAKSAGSFVLPGPEALRSEINRIEEEIENLKKERSKRRAFLGEMEKGRL